MMTVAELKDYVRLLADLDDDRIDSERGRREARLSSALDSIDALSALAGFLPEDQFWNADPNRRGVGRV